MLDIDRTSNGWQVWLTPRQTRIIYDALVADGSENEHSVKLKEWFGVEVKTKAEARRKQTGAQE